MERRSDIDYRSNIGLGAEGVPFDPPAEVVAEYVDHILSEVGKGK